jgi:hypothetical protein
MVRFFLSAVLHTGNYNTVEAVLLGCAVLVNLFGIMFESKYLSVCTGLQI